MEALKKFQSVIGATPDGDFGKETLTKAMEYYRLSKEQTAHFFGQISHESGNFKVVEENLNYSKDRLIQIFKGDLDINKDRVLSEKEKLKALQLARQPEKIANFVYANQNGNGNEASGDGWKFRGRGFIQLTGRANYKAFADSIDRPEIMEYPDLVASDYAVASAIFFFSKNKLWSLCTKMDDATILAVTKRINGGINGLSDRLTRTKKYYALLS